MVGGMETRFPMTQSAQSHRQMRSIPLCSKAVFYVFVFDYIHNSAIMQNRFFVRGDLLWGEGLGEDFDEAREGVAVEVGLWNPNEFGRKCGFGGGFE